MNEIDEIKERIKILEEEIASQRQMFVMTQDYLKKIKMDLENSKSQLEKANKYLLDSINYSTRIQKAIFQTDAHTKSIFPNSFVYFRPKDLLSGDLYWFFEKNDKKYASAIDCTGHGVAGALLVMLMISLLKQAIEEENLDSPSKIISFIGNEFYKYTSSENTQTGLYDSFDMGMLEVDPKTKTLRYSGVNRPIILVNAGKATLIKGSRVPVGFYKEVDLDLEQIEMPYTDQTSAYLFSDGIPDQFGGETNSKLTLKGLIKLLEKLDLLPIFERKIAFEEFFSDWMKSQKQIDDVLFMAILL
jgi:serine phosphatase RsbU (regulator of sigma subunit)